MKAIALAATAALVILATPAKTYAQVDRSHAKAWDAYERGSKTTTRRAARGAKRHIAQRSRSIAIRTARYSPAVARDPVINNPVTQAVGSAISTASRILPHPAGCPRRLFCGCGAAVEVFGSPIRHLWLAANWLKFPPAQPGPGMVAARRGHVMVIRQYLGNNKALVYDANGGAGRTYLHVRSLAGFKIVNPRA